MLGIPHEMVACYIGAAGGRRSGHIQSHIHYHPLVDDHGADGKLVCTICNGMMKLNN